jgi:hypothetical protein
MVQELTKNSDRSAVLDVRQRLLSRPSHEGEHTHAARGLRVESVVVAPERTHYHRTSAGLTDVAPNRPGHRHQIKGGQWTDAGTERWSSTGIARL